MKTPKHCFLTAIMIGLSCYSLLAQDKQTLKVLENVYAKIESEFDHSGIPGLSLVVVAGDSVFQRSWGYADREHKILVTPKTLFELGSTSKAFTALAILKLEDEGLVNLDERVSLYLPWFKTLYKGELVQITLRQLLHHTSGIPMEIIAKIPQGDTDDMLERTVRENNNLKLKKMPGEAFEYSTFNYDILGLIVEKVSHFPFEVYLQKNIFQTLGLNSTSVGSPAYGKLARGYKVSFFSPRAYQAPRFKGNDPAGYVISNGEDMAKWIRYQLFFDSSCFEPIIQKSHDPDFTVAPIGQSLYASGWFVAPYGIASVYHGGLNPNFSSFVGLLPSKGVGFALLANSNSEYTAYLGDATLRLLSGRDISEIPTPENSIDKVFSLLSLILLLFIAGIVTFLIWIAVGVIQRKRRLEHLGVKLILGILGGGVLTTPFIYGVYLLPKALMEFSWSAVVVWAPSSFYIGSVLFIGVVAGVWLLSVASTIFPTRKEYYRSLPLIAMLSILSGLANMVLILLLINAIGSDGKIMYLLYYFTLALVFYIFSRKIVQTKLTRISMTIVYELRMKLINKIFLSSYQKFEKIDNGRVYTTLNQDTATISNSVNIFISLLSNIITIIGVFIYLGTISFTGTLLILIVITSVAVLYYFVSRSTKVLFEQSRDAANVFSSLVDGLLYGFKELSLSGLKKREYTQEVETACAELRNKSSFALIKFVNAFFVGETLLIMVLGTISFIIPFLFPDIPNYKLMGFIMIVLYLIGPINAVLGSIPNIMQIKVSWNRIKVFIEEVKPDLKISDILTREFKEGSIDSLSVNGVVFEYKNEGEESCFKVGPINLSVNRGEILFIIGGNGSGKSTLANLLTGLYTADEGFIEVNGERVQSGELGEYYSTVFSNHHIFKKLYGVDSESKKVELEYMLRLFHLEEKVSVKDGQFSSINLSNGQRKRLSLMKCFLENSPVYLFDEWAADQDPEYKKIFYRQLLPEMRRSGKIVIAITHDDNYFDVADQIIKMDMGRMVDYKNIKVFNEASIGV